MVLIDLMRMVIQNREREAVPFLDAVFLSHIHEDHTMGLPLLAKYGYKKKFGRLVIRRATAVIL